MLVCCFVVSMHVLKFIMIQLVKTQFIYPIYIKVFMVPELNSNNNYQKS